MEADLAIDARGLTKRFRKGIHGASSLSETVFELVRPQGGERVPHNQLTAIENLTFSVRRGTVCGFVGANGSGKTTLMKILAGITLPTAGEVRVRGRVASMLETGGGFDPELTGHDNIYLGGAIMGVSKSEVASRFDSIVEFAGIAEMIGTQVKRYSSGMYSRLAMAVALHMEADILLLDEILAVSDRRFRGKCTHAIRRLRDEGKTLLFVSHNSELITRTCDEAIFLKAGRIAASGAPGDVISYYQDERG